MLSPETFELSIDQQFYLEAIRRQVAEAQSKEEMRTMLIEMACLIMVKDNIIRHLSKQAIGL